MSPSVALRSSVIVLIGGALLMQQARALVSLNDGTDRIFVTGTVGVSRDSNIFASSGGSGDFVYSGGLSAEYLRKAGWIQVNAGVGVDISRFDKFNDEDFQNPRFNAEFSKQTGRTTGAISLTAARQSRADAAVNTRNTSWNYNAGLNVKYPVIERYTFAAGVGYGMIKYIDNPAFVDLKTYSANQPLLYIEQRAGSFRRLSFSLQRDLAANFRH